MQLRNIVESDCLTILTWRNSPRVRINMFHHQEITLDEHLRWWEKIKQSKSDKYMIFEISGVPMGVVAFNKIDYKNMNADWAFYTNEIAPKGVGVLMEYYALNHVFVDLELHKLSCQVLLFNQTVIKLHERFCFKLEGVLREHYKRDGNFYDVYHYGILASEWLSQREKFQPIVSQLQNRMVQR